MMHNQIPCEPHLCLHLHPGAGLAAKMEANATSCVNQGQTCPKGVNLIESIKKIQLGTIHGKHTEQQ